MKWWEYLKWDEMRYTWEHEISEELKSKIRMKGLAPKFDRKEKVSLASMLGCDCTRCASDRGEHNRVHLHRKKTR